MATSGKLAELFIDLTLRGGAAKVDLLSLKRQVEAMDESLANGAKKYHAQTQGKLVQLGKIADREGQLAQLDLKTYQSAKYTEVAKKTAYTSFLRQKAEEVKQNKIIEAQYGKIGAMVLRLRGAAATGPLAALIAAGAAGVYYAANAVQKTSPDLSTTFDRSRDLYHAEIGATFTRTSARASSMYQTAAEGAREVSESRVGKAIQGFLEQIMTAGGRFQLPAAPAATQPASFQSFEQGWRTIQQQAASTGPLEQRMLELNLQALDQLREMNQNISINPPAWLVNVMQWAERTFGGTRA